MRRLLAIALALPAASGLAQLPGQVQVTDTVAAAPGSYLKLTLINCGATQPRITTIGGAFQQTAIQKVTTLPVNPDGTVLGYVWPSDLISCDGTVGNSLYSIQAFQNGVASGTAEQFSIASTVNPFDLTQNIPQLSLPPANMPGQDFTFRNLTLEGTLTIPGGIIRPQTYTTQYINGTPLADQFPGNDMCVKLRAANLYAVANGISYVDATHFSGNQACSVDPFQGLLPGNTPVNLTVTLGAVHMQSTVELRITNNGFTLRGAGPAATWIQYIGTAQIFEILKLQSGAYIANADSPTSDIDGAAVEDLAVIGNATSLNGIQITGAKQPYLSNINTWGMTGSGFSCNFVVSPTFYRLRTSGIQAKAMGYPGGAPAHEFYFGGTGAGATTDGTVVDAAAEYLTGVGWWLAETESMVFTSGTSESNEPGVPSGGTPGGIEIDSGSNHNTFLGTDVEANGGDSIVDNGNDNKFLGVIAIDGLGIVAGGQSRFSQASMTTGGLSVRAGAQFPDYRRGGEIVTQHANGGALYNGGGFGWNAALQGEMDYDTDVSVGPFAHLFRTPGPVGNNTYSNLGGFQSQGGVVANGPAEAPGGAAPNAVVFGNETETTVGPPGAASPLPTSPTGYLVFYLGGQRYRLPYYNY